MILPVHRAAPGAFLAQAAGLLARDVVAGDPPPVDPAPADVVTVGRYVVTDGVAVNRPADPVVAADDAVLHRLGVEHPRLVRAVDEVRDLTGRPGADDRVGPAQCGEGDCLLI